jgi:hypothetical protein
MANDTETRERDEAEAPIDEERARRAASLFDLRRLIGGLFLIYGVILTVLGIGASDAEIEKAAGVNLNLWVGLSLLGVGALFLLWAFARPLGEQLDEEEEEEEELDAGAESETASRGAGRDAVGAGGYARVRRE